MDGEELEKLHYMEKFLKKHQKDHGSRYAFKQRLAKKTMLKPKKGFPKIRGGHLMSKALTMHCWLCCQPTCWRTICTTGKSDYSST